MMKRMILAFISAVALTAAIGSMPEVAPYSLAWEESAAGLAREPLGGQAAFPADAPVPEIPDGPAYDYLKSFLTCGERRSGSPEASCGAAFIREALSGLGYETVELSFRFPRYQWDQDRTVVTRISDGRRYEASPYSYRARLPAPVTGQVVKIGDPDLKGKLVFFTMADFLPNPQTTLSEKISDDLLRAGALGVITSPSLFRFFDVSPEYCMSGAGGSWRYSTVPVFEVVHGEELVGSTVTVWHNGKIIAATGHNIIASKPGTGPYVVVMAHLDSWYAGAWDNGTGVAALLEAARLMRDDPAGVLFLAADAEEPGLIGSAVFARWFGMQSIKAVINLDCVSSFDNKTTADPAVAKILGRRLYLTGGLEPTVRAAQRSLARKDPTGSLVTLYQQRPMNGWDLAWFDGQGVPGVLFANEPWSWFYHTRRDSLEWIPAEDLEDAAAETVALIRYFRAAKSLPRPAEAIPMTFTVTADGDTVRFKARLTDAGSKPRVTVSCRYENGFEALVGLKQQKDGSFAGEFRGDDFPGEWEFLAEAKSGNRVGRRWAVLTK